MRAEKAIILKPTRERSVLLRHPWIFSGGVERVEGSPQNGETVQVRSSRGEALGWAAFSPNSRILARMWSFDPDEIINAEFFQRRVRKAIAYRESLIDRSDTNAFRLVYAESDGLPGIIVDRYVDWLVIQILSAGGEFWRDMVVDTLMEQTGIQNIYERSDADVRQLEGLPTRNGVARGGLAPEAIIIQEAQHKFSVDIQNGHKTGFYLDQRANRSYFAKSVLDKTVLNCFAYTGAFAVYALGGGAREVISVDSSGEMLQRGKQNVQINLLPEEKATWVEGDVFQILRFYRDQGRSFDVIVLDPPKFAPTVSQVERAARGYKDINLLALKLLKPGGLLFTFSCSGGISPDLFQKILSGAALDAQVDAQIVAHLHQGEDHPIALNFPESEYLKGLVIRKA